MTNILHHRVDARYKEPLLPLLNDQFDAVLIERIVSRMSATTFNTPTESAHKLSNCLAYLLARSFMSNPADDLVINLGPDEAWHVFMVFSREYTEFCEEHAGQYLHHDPAQEAAFVNRAQDTAKTVALFKRFDIPYDPALWRDHIDYQYGAAAVRGGVVAL